MYATSIFIHPSSSLLWTIHLHMFSPEDDTLELKIKSFTLQPQHRNIISFQVLASAKIMQYKAEDL